MSTTSKITYNRGIFRINKDSSHPMAPRSTQSLIQLILMVLHVHDLGRQTGAEEQAPASQKPGYLTRRPDGCEAAIDQRREERTMVPCHNPLRGLGLFKYSHIASEPVFFVCFLLLFWCFLFVVVCMGGGSALFSFFL